MLMLIFVYVLRLRNLYNICVEVSKHPNALMMEEWMICDFTVFSTLFQLYQDYKGCEQRMKIFPPLRIKVRTARSAGQHVTLELLLRLFSE